MLGIFGSASARRAGVIALGAVVSLLMGGFAYAQDAPAPAQAPAASAASPFVFPSGAALVLNFIKPDKASEWEGLMEKVKVGLQASDKPERKAQASSWRIYKTSAPGPSGSVIYFWRIDGAPADSDFSMVKMMTELFPTEARAMYEQYSAAYQNPPALQIFQLTPVIDFSK